MLRSTIRPVTVALCAAAMLSAAPLRADEPDALPLPRAKPSRVPKMPAEAGDPGTPAGNTNPPAMTNPLRRVDPAEAKPADAELPRPAGKPGRAPDPAGAKADAATKDAPKDDARKDARPDGCCDECGGRVCVTKVCVPKLGKKEITKVCWDATCEDFCVPGPSVRCGTTCGQDDCGCWSHEVWKPTCAEVRTRVVPVRKTTKRTVPSVEWKVVERCACCRAKAPCGEMPKSDGDGKAADAKEPGGQPAPAKADGEGAKKTAALPGFEWPWATWLR